MNNTLSINQSFAGAGSLNVVRSLFLKIFWLLSFVLLFALIILSVLRINSLIRELYIVQKYEKIKTTLSAENQKLEIQFSKNNTLSSIKLKIQELNLEKISKVRYIKASEGQVAKSSQTSTP